MPHLIVAHSPPSKLPKPKSMQHPNNLVDDSLLPSSSPSPKCENRSNASSPSKLSRRHNFTYHLFSQRSRQFRCLLFCAIFVITTIYVCHVSIQRRMLNPETMAFLHSAQQTPQLEKQDERAEIPGPVKQISLLGERNSGTRWIFDHLVECFNETIPVRRRLSRYKHWFQYYDPDPEIIPNGTLVIAQFRNSFEWVEAMRRVPHHASRHIGLGWREFVTKPWTMERLGLDLNVTNMTGRICQENFTYNEVVSCIYEPLGHDWGRDKLRYSEHQPLYELRTDGSGKPYKNILEFRAAKVRNFMETESYPNVFDTWSVQYEFLLKYGTEALIAKVERASGVKPNCTAFGPQEDRKKRKLDRDFIVYMNNNVDWEAEELIGYRPVSLGPVGEDES